MAILNYPFNIIPSKTLFTVLLVPLLIVLLASCGSTATPIIETPNPPATFTPIVDPTWVILDNDWLQMSYPKDWHAQVNCDPNSNDCLIHLSNLPLPTVEIGIAILPPMSEPSNAVQVDEDKWNRTKQNAMSIGAGDSLKLISVEEIEVDKIKAIKRLFEYPLLDNLTGKVKNTQYNYRVLLVNGGRIFAFEMQTISEDEFTKHIRVADQILSTISFHR